MLKQYMTRVRWVLKEFVNLPEKRGGEDIWLSARQPVQLCVMLSSVLLCSWKTMHRDSMPGDQADSWAAYLYMFRSWTQIIPTLFIKMAWQCDENACLCPPWRSDKDFCNQFTIILWSFESFCCSHLAVLKPHLKSESWSSLWNCRIIG